MGKKILVVGQGGREHALTWKLTQSPDVDKIYVAPGNPGIARIAETVNISADDIVGLLNFALEQDIDFTVVGPEGPLMAGIVNRFREKGLKIFGPTAQAALLEGSKVFTKNLLKKYNIPTASYEVFTDIDEAREYARNFTDAGKPVVIKADGLAAGKGVVIAVNREEAYEAIDSMMKGLTFGAAGERIVIEEYLVGEEVSFFAISDGRDFVSVLAAQDHKQVFDNDMGPNTGGMGAYTNPPVFTEKLHHEIVDTVIKPVIKAMEAEGCPYQGVLYAGLMITSEGPRVLEFNARFGDPETQVLMPMIKGDILPILEASACGSLADYCRNNPGISEPLYQIEVQEGTCLCVVLASQGYPGTYEKGKIISGLEKLKPDTIVFHAGTKLDNGNLVTDGGRVMAVVAHGTGINDVINYVYDEVKSIHFDGMHYRSDIGRKALK